MVLLTRVCFVCVSVQFVHQVGAAPRVRSAALASTVWVEVVLCAPAAQVESGQQQGPAHVAFAVSTS